MRGPDLLNLSRVLGRVFMRLSGLTWRVRYIRPFSGRAGMARGRAVFFAFWHGRQLPLIHTHRGEGVAVLVSRNTDGQYVTNVLHSMGFDTIRGSSSRGGMEAVRGMAGRLRNGRDCAITPDGPRGPLEKAKAGTAHISRLGGRPVVPMGTSAWPAVRFHSWDRFMLPLPFARVVVVEGRPVRCMVKGDDPEEWLAALETGLRSVTSYADLLASPSARLMARCLSVLGSCLTLPAFIGLFFRPLRERRERKGLALRRSDRPVWLHGSSLGELNGLIPYIEKLREQGIPVHVTCFTPAGRKFIEDRGLQGGYIPLDVPLYAERFLRKVRPRALVLAETEIWPNTLMRTLMLRVPCLLVNGRLSTGSLRGYRLFAPLLGRMLSCFSAVVARTGDDMKRFARLGVDERVLGVSGDSKFLADAGDPPPQWRGLLDSCGPVLVAGSTRAGEEETVLDAALAAGYFPVMAPRHLERVGEVESLMVRKGFTPVRWSVLNGTPGEKLDFDSVIVDVHGVLAAMYGIGDAAFVGGTLAPVGGHNVLEPLMRGVMLLVGPHYENFREAVEVFRDSGAARVFSTSRELAEILTGLKSGPDRREDIIRDFREMRQSLLRGIFRALMLTGIPGCNGKT
ncbi:MAG: DUF374 domain-containing protein [Candidatus Fermentibacteraceae bacterium]|nr:DUF374 domain-containing protein [Candidatus Fermentibacteraceae bacterium]MBN2607672.1 DUF374 domain-containing protein [Candidatus Fermentibacteraceae bacterium]